MENINECSISQKDGKIILDWEYQPETESIDSNSMSNTSINSIIENNHELDVFRELFQKGHLCDVQIKLKNDTCIRAHGIILASKSTFFRSYLFSNCQQKGNLILRFSDICEETMNSVLRYIYGDTLELSLCNVCDILICADRFSIEGLKTTCIQYILEKITEETAVEAWHFAESHAFEELKNVCQNYILSNFEAISRDHSKTLCALSGKELLQFVKSDKLKVSSENDVLQCINTWATSNNHTFQDIYICQLLLKGVRQSKLDRKNPFGKFPKLEKHVKECEFCKRYYNLLLIQISTDTVSREFEFTLKEYQRSILWYRPRVAYQVILAVGGWSGQQPSPCVEMYNPQSDHWSILKWTNNIYRAYHGLVLLNGTLYVVGGYDGRERLNTMHAFDRPNLKWVERATMHDRRCYVCVVSCKNYIYAIGGHDGLRRLRTVERYNPITNQWTYLQSMAEIRSDAHAVMLDDLIYVIGGFDGDVIHRSIEVYDPSTNTWSYSVSMKTPRSGVKAVVHNDTIYAIGGFDGKKRLKTIEYWNRSENSWVVIDTEMTIARSNFGITVCDKFIVVIGGYDDERNQTTSHCEMFSSSDQKWHSMCYLPNMEGISALSVIVVEGLDAINEYSKSSTSLTEGSG